MTLDQATYSMQGDQVPAIPEPMPTAELTSAVLREPHGIRLMLRGELDIGGVPEAEAAVRAAAQLTDGRLVIDLTELAFMDAFGARALLRAADEAFSAEREVVIANPNRHVLRLFELITLGPSCRLVTELVRSVA